jgi:uncharacterized protein (DUF302 family)
MIFGGLFVTLKNNGQKIFEKITDKKNLKNNGQNDFQK